MAADELASSHPLHSRTTIISALHPDLIGTHILSRLDGPALASAASSSSLLNALCTDENLWRRICNHAWPSTADQRLRRLISDFPAGHRALFSDCFPTLHHRRPPPSYRHPPPPKLVSAVDIKYQDELIYSKVEEIETVAGLELCSQFQIDLLGPKETVPIPAALDYRDNASESELKENLSISWILIDPTQKRSANISSLRPAVVDRNWVTGDIQLRFVTVLGGVRTGELVQCVVAVTCGGREGGELQVREVSLTVEDMEGKQLSWKDSLVILGESIKSGKRRRKKAGEEKEWYEEFMRMKRERRERQRRRETRRELACIATGVAIVVAFWVFVAVRIFLLLQSWIGIAG